MSAPTKYIGHTETEANADLDNLWFAAHIYPVRTGEVAASVKDLRYEWGAPRRYGAVGDNVSRPLSTIFGTLAAAQAVYPSVAALTEELDGVAVQTAANHLKTVGGGRLHLHAGIYRCNKTITITNAMIVEGEGTAWTVAGGTPDPGGTTTLQFATGVTGMILTSTGQSYKTVVRDLMLRGGNFLIDGTNDGIQNFVHAVLDNVIVWQFGRYGVATDTSLGGNASNSHYRSVWAVQNRSHGFYTNGPDSNVILFEKCDAMVNGGVGFYDTALYYNTYMSPHADSNAGGAFTLGNTGHQVINPYIETTTSNVIRFLAGSNGFVWQRGTRVVAGGSFVIESAASAHNIIHGDQFAVTPGASGTITHDAASCRVLSLRCASNITMAAPTNAYHGAEIQLIIWNVSGGALTVTWTGGSRGWILAGAWASPANGTARAITFRYDSFADRWSEVCRTAADYA